MSGPQFKCLCVAVLLASFHLSLALAEHGSSLVHMSPHASLRNQPSARLVAEQARAELARVRTGEAAALIAAVKGNDERAARRLIAAGLHPDDYPRWRWTRSDGALPELYSDSPLIEASRAGHTEMVRLLLAKNADPNLQSPGAGSTALMFASLCGFKSVVRLLLAEGANVDAKTIFGSSALRCAKMNKHTAVTTILIDAGATEAAQRDQHLFEAAKAGDAPRVQRFLRDDAQPDAYLDHCTGNSALMAALLALLDLRTNQHKLRKEYTDVLHLLLQAGSLSFSLSLSLSLAHSLTHTHSLTPSFPLSLSLSLALSLSHTHTLILSLSLRADPDHRCSGSTTRRTSLSLNRTYAHTHSLSLSLFLSLSQGRPGPQKQWQQDCANIKSFDPRLPSTDGADGGK